MKWKRKSIVFLAVLMVLAIAFTGCAQSDNKDLAKNGKDGPVENGSSDSGGAPAKKVDISIFSFFNVPDEDANSKAFFAMKEKFAQDFPEVTVTEEAVSHDEYETKMKTYAAANELPNLFLLKGTMIPSLVDNKQIVEIEPYLNMISSWKEGYKDGVFVDFLYNDKEYAFPYQMGNNHNIFWNSDIFAKCGIKEFPNTWQDFLTAIETFKSNGYIPIAMGNKGKWLAPSLIFNTIVYRYVPVDWYYSLKNNKGAKFTDPDFIAATKCMQDLAQMGTFNSDMNSIDREQQRALYYNKQSAMFIEGFWAVDSVINDAPEDVLKATKIAQFPAIPEGKGDGKVNQAAAGWGWAVSSKTDDLQKQAIVDFANYITGTDSANIAVANNGLPASKPTKVDEANLTPLYLELLRLNNECVYAPVFDVQLPPQVVDAFYSNLQEVLINTMTPEKYCELLQKEMDATR